MNIFDYLNWRGDVPFSADPFNEVDGLVLSELAYTDFGAIVPARGEISLREAAELFFARTPREKVKETPGYTAPAPLLMEGMSSGERFRDCVLKNYINVVDKDKTEQMSALTVLLGDGSRFVAFRGTDSSLVGWREDMELSYKASTSGQERAVAYLQQEARESLGLLRAGGHSKGGNFAVFASAYCPKELQDRIYMVYSYDGPGFRDEILQSEGYMRLIPRIRHIVPESAIFGMLLSDLSQHRVVKSSASGLVQHDGFTWQVERNRFVTGELNETARLMDKTMDSWLDEMTDEERGSFFDTLFTLLESTGQESIRGVFGQKLRSTEAMLSSMVSLPKEKRKELLSFLRKLLQIGGRNAISRHSTRLLLNAEEHKNLLIGEDSGDDIF